MDVTGLGFQKGETPFEKEPSIVIESKSKFNPDWNKCYVVQEITS